MDFPNLDSPEQPDFPDLDGAGSSPVFPTLSDSGEACSSPSSSSPESPQHHPRWVQRQYPRPHPRSQQARNIRQRIETARSPELDPGPTRFQSLASSVMDLDHHAPADDGMIFPVLLQQAAQLRQMFPLVPHAGNHIGRSAGLP